MAIVTFTQEELWQLQQIAHKRNDPKMGTVPNYRWDKKQGDLEIHYKGVKAEYAVSKLFNVPFDVTFSLDGDNNSPDHYIGDRSVQVKWNGYDYGGYRINSLAEFNTDIGIIVVPMKPASEHAVNVLGWISQKEFLAIHERKNFGHGFRFVVEQKGLHPIEELLRITYQERVVTMLQEGRKLGVDPWEMLRGLFKQGVCRPV